MGKKVIIKSTKRGLTRMTKLKTTYRNSGGKKKRVKFDSVGRLEGKHKAKFVSYLGDLVRESVGVSVLNWKQVSKEKKDKLWEEITVFSKILLLFCIVNYCSFLLLHNILNNSCCCSVTLRLRQQEESVSWSDLELYSETLDGNCMKMTSVPTWTDPKNCLGFQQDIKPSFRTKKTGTSLWHMYNQSYLRFTKVIPFFITWMLFILITMLYIILSFTSKQIYFSETVDTYKGCAC